MKRLPELGMLSAICAAMLSACIPPPDRYDGYQGSAPSAQPQQTYQPPPPQPAYRPPPPPPPRQRRIVRRANLNSYCKSRRYSGAGCLRDGRPVCQITRMGFNTTYVAKTSKINYIDVCRRQYRTRIYETRRCQVRCIIYETVR